MIQQLISIVMNPHTPATPVRLLHHQIFPPLCKPRVQILQNGFQSPWNNASQACRRQERVLLKSSCADKVRLHGIHLPTDTLGWESAWSFGANLGCLFGMKI